MPPANFANPKSRVYQEPARVGRSRSNIDQLSSRGRLSQAVSAKSRAPAIKSGAFQLRRPSALRRF